MRTRTGSINTGMYVDTYVCRRVEYAVLKCIRRTYRASHYQWQTTFHNMYKYCFVGYFIVYVTLLFRFQFLTRVLM